MATPKEMAQARAEVKKDGGLKGIMSAFTSGASARELKDLDAEANEEADVGETADKNVSGPESEHSVHANDSTDGLDDEEGVDGTSNAEEGESGERLDDGENDDSGEEQTESESTEEAEGSEESDNQEHSEEISKLGVEEHWLTDEKGRRKVKIDFGSKRVRQQLAGAVGGMRKFKHERDEALAKLKGFEDPEGLPAKKLAKFEAMDKAYAADGEAGVLRELGVDVAAFVKAFNDKNAALEALKKDPAKWAEHQIAETKKAADAEVARIKKEREDERTARQKEVDEANQKTFDAARERAFSRFRLPESGKDSAVNKAMNEVFWDTFNARIERLPDDTVLDDAALAEIAGAAAKALNMKVQLKVAKGVKDEMDKRSRDATAAAQREARAGMGGRRAAKASKMEESLGKKGIKGFTVDFLSGKFGR